MVLCSQSSLKLEDTCIPAVLHRREDELHQHRG